MASAAVRARGNVLGKYVPARYILAILGSIGMAITYGLKVNLSVAMVAMLNHTAIRNASALSHDAINAPITLASNFSVHTIGDADDDVCVESPSATEAADGPFDWSEPLQGAILSCYFWGYFVSQIPGARVAENFSAKYVMLFSVVINVVCTLLTPVMAKASYVAMICMRIGEGIGGGVTFPAMHVMLASWAPPAERGIMSSIVYAGTSLGTVSSMLMAGLLAGSCGWESVFYVMGGLSCIWIVLWVILVQDKPSQQPLMSAEEREMIAASLGVKSSGDEKPKQATPWRAIFTSLPFLAICLAHVCSNWGWYMLLIELPFYMKQVLKFNIKKNAIATALPFLTMWFFSIVLSKLLEKLRARETISNTTARKVSTLCASFVPMVCLLTLCFIGCQRLLAVIIMGIGITSIGGMFSGFLANHIDLAPNFAGTLIAITNTAATVPGIIVPIFVGKITHGNQTIEAWRVIFFVTIALYLIEMVGYLLMGSGEEQPWNKGTENYDHENDDAATVMVEDSPLTKTGEGKKINYTIESSH